jgi:hypothetical protein
MKDLLTVNNNLVIPSVYAMTISEFEKLSIKELSFVFFYADHRSSYSAYDDEERQAKLEEDLKVKVNPKLAGAVKKYQELSETHGIKLLKAARSSVNKLEKYFQNIDLTAMDAHGKLLYQAKDLVANLSKVGEVVEGLDRLEELVQKQQAKDNPNRAGVKTNKYSE